MLYQIRHSKSSKAIIVHADSIKPYRGSKTPAQYTEPNTAANAPIPEDSERNSAFEDNVQMDSDNRSKTTDGEVERTSRGGVIRIPVRYREWQFLWSYAKCADVLIQQSQVYEDMHENFIQNILSVLNANFVQDYLFVNHGYIDI